MRNSQNWSMKEDQALRIIYVERKIQKWTKISKILAEEFKIYNKNPKKCRERFNNHLNPAINRQEWTQEQQNLLMFYQTQMGNKWAEIARKLPGRTDNFVKNKFYSKFRYAIRNINQQSQKYKIQKYKEITIGFIYKIIAVIDYKFKHETSDVQEDLIELAQKVKSQIILFEKIKENQENQDEENLTILFKNIQLINIYFKKKISKRKRCKFSQIIKNTDHIQSAELSIDQAPLIKTEEFIVQQKPQPEAQAAYIYTIVQTPVKKRSKINIKKEADIIPSLQSVKYEQMQELSPQQIRIPPSSYYDPWGINCLQQNFQI